MNNTLVIEWDALRCGEFPIDVVTSCECSVTIESISVFRRKISITTNSGELITPEVAFHLGLLVENYRPR